MVSLTATDPREVTPHSTCRLISIQPCVRTLVNHRISHVTDPTNNVRFAAEKQVRSCLNAFKTMQRRRNGRNAFPKRQSFEIPVRAQSTVLYSAARAQSLVLFARPAPGGDGSFASESEVVLRHAPCATKAYGNPASWSLSKRSHARRGFPINAVASCCSPRQLVNGRRFVPRISHVVKVSTQTS